MKYLLATTAALAVAGPACAQQIELKPVAEARLRYEHVDQDGLAQQADALTVRARAGLTATSGALSATLVGQGTLAVIDRYFDGFDNAAIRPLVADPQNVALYIAQLQYRTKALTLTGGRQKIVLDDETASIAACKSLGAVGAVKVRESLDKKEFDSVWNARPKVFEGIAHEETGEPTLIVRQNK